MQIRRDLSSLPSPEVAAKAPTPNMVLVPAVFEHWNERYVAGHEYLPAIPELPFRNSDVGKRCDRELGYALAGVEKSNPPEVASNWRFRLGQFVHDEFQAALVEVMRAKGEDWRIEDSVDLRPIGIEGSAHGDVVCYRDDKPFIVVEVKSVPGFSFKTTATTFKGPPQGPKHDHVMQAALIAAALGAPNVLIVYISLESVSPQMVTSLGVGEVGRFAAEWKYTVEELRPLIDHEIGRIQRAIRNHQRQLLPARTLDDPEVPGGAVVTDVNRGAWMLYDPATGNVTRTGTTWRCDYCHWRDRCRDDGPDAIQLSVTAA